MTIAAIALAGGVGEASAQDMVMTKADSSVLADADIGKPYWGLQAECAGFFGASYRFELDRGRARIAETDKATGVSMLSDALERLQIDRKIDSKAALAIVEPVVESGRARARRLIAESTSPTSKWNIFRSECLDIDEAYNNRRP